MKKIVFVTSTLDVGGSERVLTEIANMFSGHGYDVTILSLKEGEPFYRLAKEICVVALPTTGVSANLFQAIKNNVKRLFNVRRNLQEIQPNTVISFGTETNVLTLIACFGSGVPVVISERSNPVNYPYSPIWRFLRRVSYSFASTLVVQTRFAERCFGYMNQSKITRIPNPLSQDAVPTEKVGYDFQYVIAVGRLGREKGFDVLIGAFAKIAGEFQDLNLVILGEGAERAALEEHARKLQVESRVVLPGAVHNPADYMADASLFVLPSRFEGFPNALLEAMACGLPVVATNCPGGPSDLIEHENNGILVPVEDETAIANTIKVLMRDEDLRHKIAIEAKDTAALYAGDAIFPKWEELVIKNERG